MKVFRLTYTLLILACLACVAHAEVPWGIKAKVVEGTSSHVAIDNLINKRPIRYAMSEQVSPQEEAIFKNNIHKWPRETLRIIRESKRTKEFQDIIPILEYELVLQAVPLNASPDIYLEIAPYENMGSFKEAEDTPYATILIAEQDREYFDSTSLHEIGHYFGLGDQYSSGRLNSHDEYSSDVNETCGSVMNGSDTITEDDADGFINLIDFRLAQRHNNQFSARAEKGWKSLCPRSKNVYKKAKTITRNREDPFAFTLGDEEVLHSREYTNGNLVRQTHAFLSSPLQLFAVTPSDEVKRNRRTNLITSLRSVLRATLERPGQDEFAEGPLIWKREFSYSAPEGEPGQRVVPVQVTEFVNGAPLPKYTLRIHEDGRLSGSLGGSLSATEYTAQMVTHGIYFKLQNRKILAFVLDDDDNNISFAGNLQYHFVRLFQKNEDNNYDLLEECPLPLNSDCDWRADLYLETFETHRNHLMSFYQNFYEPLFGTKEKEGIRAQITKSLVIR